MPRRHKRNGIGGQRKMQSSAAQYNMCERVGNVLVAGAEHYDMTHGFAAWHSIDSIYFCAIKPPGRVNWHAHPVCSPPPKKNEPKRRVTRATTRLLLYFVAIGKSRATRAINEELTNAANKQQPHLCAIYTRLFHFGRSERRQYCCTRKLGSNNRATPAPRWVG